MAQSNIVSLMNTLELTLHSNRLHFFHAKQQITTLYRKVRILQKLLQDFPQNRSDEELNLFEIRIRDSAYAIEDVVEATITEQILPVLPVFMENASMPDEKSSESLEEAIEEVDSIVEELLKRSCGLKGLQPGKSLQVASSRLRAGGGSKGIANMAGFNEDILQLKDRLTGQESKLQAIPIVGMVGIGKSTLARNLYQDSLIEYYFDVRAWVTISQTYRARDVLQSLLKGIGASTREQRQISIQDLTLSLYKNLKGRRYLIVLDMWNTDVWDDLKRLFPDDCNGSRVMLTTRLVEVAVYSTNSSSPPHQLELLDEDKSWELLCEVVFGSQDCPSELEGIGRMIARNCKRLPVAISVIGGLLANSSMTREFWNYVAKNVSSLAIKSDEHCHEILSLSYRNLPHHLKPCFLYFGAFPEDRKISVTKIIRLWIAEGFLKPNGFKSLERTAEEYLSELIDRNLVFVHRTGWDGKKRRCIIPDLLRDFCIKEAQKEKFLSIINGSAQSSEDVPTRRMMHQDTLGEGKIRDDLRAALESLIHVRSLFRAGRVTSAFEFHERLMLLRVLDFLGAIFVSFPFDIFFLVNLRYLAFSVQKFSVIPPSLSVHWKLQTLIIHEDHVNFRPEGKLPYVQTNCELDMPSQMLQMTHLRHIEMAKSFRLDCDDSTRSVVLKDMETLFTVADFRCTIGFLKKFPNLRKLGVCYYATNAKNWSHYHLENIVNLSKLENLKCVFKLPPKQYMLPNLAFPHSLRKLTLSMSGLLWKDMTIIGSLSCLEVLKLKDNAFVGAYWEPTEEEFRRLEFLLIETTNLEVWMAEDTHFPRLKHLTFRHCHSLNEIPSGIGEIATLEMIEIDDCTHSAASSARKILEEQRSMENHVLQVRVCGLREKLNRKLQKLADSF